MIRIVFAGLLAVAAAAQAQPAAASADTAIEATMLVTGTLDIETDGSVSAHAIDRAAQVPAYVRGIIDRAVPGWRFEPVEVDGQAVRARARMTLRLLATPIGDDDLQVSLASATFGEHDPDDSDYVTRVRMRAPEYPYYALERNASGTVYLLLRIDRDGRVAESVAEQVNLMGTADAETMDTLRKRFAESALAVTHRWKFKPPTTGEDADDSSWSVRVPVQFAMAGSNVGKAPYGQWEAYVPGPRQAASWLRDDSAFEANDAIATNSLQQVGAGYRLLTPLQPEG